MAAPADKLLRLLASDAMRAAVERHYRVRLAFRNCHRAAVFRAARAGSDRRPAVKRVPGESPWTVRNVMGLWGGGSPHARVVQCGPVARQSESQAAIRRLFSARRARRPVTVSRVPSARTPTTSAQTVSPATCEFCSGGLAS